MRKKVDKAEKSSGDEAEDESGSDSEEESDDDKLDSDSDGDEEEAQEGSDDESEDEEVARVNQMAHEFEEVDRQQKEYAMNIDRKYAKQ